MELQGESSSWTWGNMKPSNEYGQRPRQGPPTRIGVSVENQQQLVCLDYITYTRHLSLGEVPQVSPIQGASPSGIEETPPR